MLMNGQAKSVFFCAIVVAFGGFVFGLDAALISGTVKFVSQEFGLSDLQAGMVVSSTGFGVLLVFLPPTVIGSNSFSHGSLTIWEPRIYFCSMRFAV